MTKLKAEKVIAHIKEQPYKLEPDTIQYIIELANVHPRWSVERIFKEAFRPRLRTSIILPLTPKMKRAFTKAAKQYQISYPDICYHVLTEWFTAHNFY